MSFVNEMTELVHLLVNEKNQLLNDNDGEQSSTRVVWHIFSKERNLHFTIVMKTDLLGVLDLVLWCILHFEQFSQDLSRSVLSVQ